MSSTPWAEYMMLARELAQGKPHHGPNGNLRRYQQLAFERDYCLDLVHITDTDPHAWLLELGVGIIPHTSGHNGPVMYSGGRALDSGSFWHHLTLNGAPTSLLRQMSALQRSLAFAACVPYLLAPKRPV